MATIIQYTVKLGLQGLRSVQLVERGRNHVLSMTDNPIYPTPTPALEDITKACDLLEAASIAVEQNGGKLDYLARNERARELRALIKELSGYVQAVSAGDPEKIASAGFQTRKLPAPVGNMTAATNMRARITTMLGELALRWDKVKGRMIYVLWMCEGDPLVEENWKQMLMTSKNFHTATGLESHKAYCFRVVAVGAAGAGPASDTAIARPL